jgi:hypothetical protein
VVSRAAIQWQLHLDRGPVVRRAGDFDGSAECVDSVGEANETRAALKVSASDSVVVNGEFQDSGLDLCVDLDARAVGMFG